MGILLGDIYVSQQNLEVEDRLKDVTNFYDEIAHFPLYISPPRTASLRSHLFQSLKMSDFRKKAVCLLLLIYEIEQGPEIDQSLSMDRHWIHITKFKMRKP